MSEPTTVEKPITSEQEGTESGESYPILSPAEVSTLHYFGLGHSESSEGESANPLPPAMCAAVVLFNLFVYLCFSFIGVLSSSCYP